MAPVLERTPCMASSSCSERVVEVALQLGVGLGQVVVEAEGEVLGGELGETGADRARHHGPLAADRLLLGFAARLLAAHPLGLRGLAFHAHPLHGGIAQHLNRTGQCPKLVLPVGSRNDHARIPAIDARHDSRQGVQGARNPMGDRNDAARCKGKTDQQHGADQAERPRRLGFCELRLLLADGSSRIHDLQQRIERRRGGFDVFAGGHAVRNTDFCSIRSAGPGGRDGIRAQLRHFVRKRPELTEVDLLGASERLPDLRVFLRIGLAAVTLEACNQLDLLPHRIDACTIHGVNANLIAGDVGFASNCAGDDRTARDPRSRARSTR